LLNACQKNNEFSDVYGCNFHFGQAIWRKIQSLGLAYKYECNDEVRKIFLMILNLSFLAIDEIFEAFEYIKLCICNNNFQKMFKEFLEYFVKYYLGSKNKSAVYKLEFCSVNRKVLNDLLRTTNSLEGWHRGFKKLVEVVNPNLGRLIDCLRIDAAKTRAKLARMKWGTSNSN
jgi:hypothetical protein